MASGAGAAGWQIGLGIDAGRRHQLVGRARSEWAVDRVIGRSEGVVVGLPIARTP